MVEGKGRKTAQGNLAKPDVVTVATWVKEAWESIPADMVIRSFLKTSISNNLDGSQDDAVWEESDESGGEEEEEEEADWCCDEKCRRKTMMLYFESRTVTMIQSLKDFDCVF